MIVYLIFERPTCYVRQADPDVHAASKSENRTFHEGSIAHNLSKAGSTSKLDICTK